MKRLTSMLCLLCLLLSACARELESVSASTTSGMQATATAATTVPTQASAEDLVISPELEAAVRMELGGYTGDLTKENLANTVSLLVHGVTDENAVASDFTEDGLQGLEYFTGLRTLELIGYEGETLSFLSDVPDLCALRLTGLNVERPKELELLPLKSLKRLRQLEISNYRIGNLAAVGELMALEVLWLRNCGADDLKPLARLQNLTELAVLEYDYLRQTYGLADVSPLANLPTLTFLKLSGFDGDVSPLKNMPLTSLGLQHCSLKSYAVLPVTVEYLLIEETNFTDRDMDSLKLLPNLRHLQMRQRLNYEVALKELGVPYVYPFNEATDLGVSGEAGRLQDDGMMIDKQQILREYLAEKAGKS